MSLKQRRPQPRRPCPKAQYRRPLVRSSEITTPPASRGHPRNTPWSPVDFLQAGKHILGNGDKILRQTWLQCRSQSLQQTTNHTVNQLGSVGVVFCIDAFTTA